ncbi:Transcription factor [Trichoderma lentiforme]|uniref:Transcription factor n=1 Tax=Trichoderma lentiforme TaxID=1567552 RepID=A0A9P5C762_9HYPO|nr:Transcription factor [Trichoderma lentiforme]
MEFFYFSQMRAPSYLVQQWCYSGLTGADLTIYEPPLPVIEWRKDLATVYYLATHLKAFPLTFAREAKTPFIHSSLYSQSLPKQIKDTYGVCRLYSLSIENNGLFCFQSLHKKVDEIIKEYPTLCSFSDLLASLQSLILYLLICLFDKDPQQRRFAEAHMNTLNQWTRHVWEQAPTEISGKLSPWQAWVFAESVRRSIIISYLIRGVYHLTRFGYHPHSMFVETLPFSRHTWLWDIPSRTEWTSLPPNLSQSIVSYHEYTNEFANDLIHPYHLFETLLLVIRFGKDSFNQHLGIA